MNAEQLLKQIIHLRLELAQLVQEHSFNFQHPRVIQASQYLDNLIVQYQNMSQTQS
jgi:hypothetical protein